MFHHYQSTIQRSSAGRDLACAFLIHTCSRLQTLDLRENPFVTLPEAIAREYRGVITSLPNEVMPNLHISGQAGAENFEWLKANRIALILNMAAEIAPKYPTKFHYCCVPCMGMSD